MAQHDTAPVVAGVVAALVGFSSSFVVVLAALVAVGATPDQAASGLLALCVVQAVAMLWLLMFFAMVLPPFEPIRGLLQRAGEAVLYGTLLTLAWRGLPRR